MVELALEEWQQWLDVTKDPFLIIHFGISSFFEAIQGLPRIFFRFYQLGSKNHKPFAVS